MVKLNLTTFKVFTKKCLNNEELTLYPINYSTTSAKNFHIENQKTDEKYTPNIEKLEMPYHAHTEYDTFIRLLIFKRVVKSEMKR